VKHKPSFKKQKFSYHWQNTQCHSKHLVGSLQNHSW